MLSVWTNEIVSPKEALEEASKILTAYFLQIYEPKSVISSEPAKAKPSIADSISKLTIDELDLPTRICNSLRNGGIETLGQLLSTNKKDLVSMRNMGNKSITIVEEKLKEKGVALTV
jgi:DNA-directed RNA polymerase subunit alpha